MSIIKKDMATKNIDNVELVVGIDFGTSYSAYAYSYSYEQDKIFMNSVWPSGSNACKEMTAILFNEDKKFVAFGEEAVLKFNALTEEQVRCWYLFKNFKMALYHEKVSSNVQYLKYY